MSEQVDQAQDIWLGDCAGCGAHYDIPDDVIRSEHPEYAAAFDEGIFVANCSKCDRDVEMSRINVVIKPFSSWNVLPPAEGCPTCGKDHEPQLPHDLHQLVYQYWFRNNEAKAGREERWPTWKDAMAHCDEETQELWTHALAEHGITV